MIKIAERYVHAIALALGCGAVACLLAFCKPAKSGESAPAYTEILSDSISKIVSGYPGEIGVALIINDSDTVAVNDLSKYPMMSVFKVHQAIAVCHDFDSRGLSLDSMLTVQRTDLDANTWSPMLKEHQEPVISLAIKDLLRYALVLSDNNASNLMFRRLSGVDATDSLLATIIPRESFRIAYSEEEMAADHRKAYANYTSPLGAATLMDRLFTDSLISAEKQDFIRNTLKECVIGNDRIIAPLLGADGISVAHKTGSGYTDENGVLAAHNDVAFISLPDGTHYTLAVFVKDFKGNETQASEAIAHISSAVYAILTKDRTNP